MSKKTKTRSCPAAGKTIEAFECAHGRHTTFACPEECPFNPFSFRTYNRFGADIEQPADEKFFKWVTTHAGDLNQFEQQLRRLIDQASNTAYFHFLAWHGVYRRDANGQTSLERWANEGFPGLNTDERLLMRGRLRMRPAILEVRRVVDDTRLEAVDILDPDQAVLVIADRGLARQALRFGYYFVDIVPLPHYARIFGACLQLPYQSPMDPGQVVREIFRHLGAGSTAEELRGWLAEHYTKFENAVTAVGLARRQAMFKLLDAQFGKAVYELQVPYIEARERLDSSSSVSEDPLTDEERAEGFNEGRVWFAEEGDAASTVEVPGAVLGRVILGQTHWRLEALGAARLEKFRQRFEVLLEGRARFAGERRDDLGARLRMQEPPYDPSLVPPALLETPPQPVVTFSRLSTDEADSPADAEAQMRVKDDRQFVDDTVPALSGKTPREAAKDPALRPQLISLVKHRIYECDLHNLETGAKEDLNWMVRELGLEEILVDPPPPRPRLKLDATAGDEEELPLYLGLPDPPALPPGPWPNDEAVSVFSKAVGSSAELSEVYQYFDSIQYPVLHMVAELLEGILKEDELQLFLPIVAATVLSFAPKGTRPPEIWLDDLTARFDRELDAFRRMAGPEFGRQINEWMKGRAQPGLLTVAFGLLLKVLQQTAKDQRPRDAADMTMLLALGVVIDELDQAAREG